MAAKESTLSTLHEMLAEMFIEDTKICRVVDIPMSVSSVLNRSLCYYKL